MSWPQSLIGCALGSESCCLGAGRLQRTGLALLRVAFGLAIAYHGQATLLDPEGMGKFAGFVEKLGFPAPVFFAYCAKLTELAGGLALTVGLLTRVSAAFLVFNMSVAAFMAHGTAPILSKGGGPSKELPLAYLVPFVVILLAGPGALAVDNLLRRRFLKEGQTGAQTEAAG